jgi:hypothetical protein
MTSPRPKYGTVEGETPAVLHRYGTLADRSCCGKKLAAGADRNHPGRLECQRCRALDESRRAGIPDWFDRAPGIT